MRWHLLVAAVLLCAATQPSAAQSERAERRYVPPLHSQALSREEQQTLERSASSVSTAVVRLTTQAGTVGTAFCVDVQHRLFATAAHLVQSAQGEGGGLMVVWPSGETSRVERGWVHPDYGGPTDPSSIDVAFVQLAPESPEPPVSVRVNSGFTREKIEGAAVGVLGFPLDQQALRGPEGVVRPHPVAGIVWRTADKGSAQGRAWSFGFTTPAGLGYSGGPVYAADGTVIGVYSGFSLTGSAEATGTSWVLESNAATAVYAILDLIESAQGLEKRSLNTYATAQPNQMTDTNRPDRTGDFVRGWEGLLDVFSRKSQARNLKEACDVLNAALQEDPYCFRLYAERAQLFEEYVRALPAGPRSERLKYWRWIAADARRAMELYPPDNYLHARFYSALATLAALSGDAHLAESTLAYVDGILAQAAPAWSGYKVFCAARARALAALGRYNEALAALDETVARQRFGEDPDLVLARADVYELMGDLRQSEALRQRIGPVRLK